MTKNEERKTPSFEELKQFLTVGNSKKKLTCELKTEGSIAIVCKEKGKPDVIAYSEPHPGADPDAITTNVIEYELLRDHVGHQIECAYYGQGEEIWNIAIECMDCYCVIYDQDNPEMSDKDLQGVETENIGRVA